VCPVLLSQMDFVSSYHLVPIHVLNSALMEDYYNKHLFPVSASFLFHYIGVTAYVFCHVGMSVCLFVVSCEFVV